MATGQNSGGLQKFQRTSSSTSEESLRFHSSGSLDQESREAPEAAKEVELSSSAPTKEPFLRIGSKRMGKNFNPFSSSSSSSSTSSSSKPQGGDKDAQLPNRLLQLAKTKPKKEKKKKGKGGEREETGQALVMSEPHDDDGESPFLSTLSGERRQGSLLSEALLLYSSSSFSTDRRSNRSPDF
ncbi:unnamed protein product [Boreogadus saida]